jgi:lysozyme
MNIDHLKFDLMRDEGCKLKLYTDTQGNPTIGIGRDLIDPGLSQDEADYLFNNDVNRVIAEVSTISGYDNLTDARQGVLANMCFNLGIEKLLGFHNMLEAIANGDIQTAYNEILNSAAARELPNRYKRLAETWLNG